MPTILSQLGPADASPREIRDFQRAGLPEHLTDRATEYLVAGLRPRDVAPYLPTPALPDFYYPFVPWYIQQGVPADTVLAFQAAGVEDCADLVKLWRAGCTPDTAATWLAPFRNDPAQQHFTRGTVTSFANAYDRASTRTHGNTDLINAFLTVVPATTDARYLATGVADAIEEWTEPDTGTLRVPVSLEQATRLHAAGYTPTEVAADPRLITADPDTLAVLAALRG